MKLSSSRSFSRCAAMAVWLSTAATTSSSSHDTFLPTSVPTIRLMLLPLMALEWDFLHLVFQMLLHRLPLQWQLGEKPAVPRPVATCNKFQAPTNHNILLLTTATRA